jgi:hypothetical protein
MTAPPPPGADWYNSEESTRVGMISELQRILRRMRARPIPVLVLAALVTFGITRKFATKPVIVEAQVVLALAEGSLSSHVNSIPVDELRQYVISVLLPDNKLIRLIERRDLYRLRKNLGPEFAIEQLRGNFSVQIWKNSFVYYDDADENAQRSARIGLAVTDADPDQAFDIAHDLASIAIESCAAQRQKLADEISGQAAVLRDATNDKLDHISQEMSQKQAAITLASQRGKPEVAGILRIDLAALEHERKTTEDRLGQIASSHEQLASEIAAAGLDMSLSIVEEYRPERPTRSNFVLVMIAAVIGTGALVGAALLLGAFDSRVHDVDDVVRLGLPVLGHVPGFPGDRVGSMQTRSAARARVPSFLRWRSHR